MWDTIHAPNQAYLCGRQSNDIDIVHSNLHMYTLPQLCFVLICAVIDDFRVYTLNRRNISHLSQHSLAVIKHFGWKLSDFVAMSYEDYTKPASIQTAYLAPYLSLHD